MSARLVYLIGPSGSGKDSLLQWLLQNIQPNFPLHLARRCITRATQASGEQHEPVSHAQWDRLRDAGALALHWQANGLSYGVRSTELAPLALGHCVLVNGSRAHLVEARQRLPELTAVHISVTAERLQQRLTQRGREDAKAVESRLRRNQSLPAPAGCADISNDGTIEVAGAALLAVVQGLLPAATAQRV
jgi:ribose 1,5-bisphosphokinase